MKFGFVTCVELGLSCMRAIYEVGGKLDLAITLEDSQAVKKSGRVYLDDFCRESDIPLLKSRNINDVAVVERIKASGIDWLFIIGWSQIAGDDVLDSPTRGTIGMHPTLLPQGRGRSAIPWAILKSLPKTGVTMFKLDKGVDTGLLIEQFEIPLDDSNDAEWLYQEVNQAHADLMKRVYPKLLSGSLEMIHQDEGKASTWPGRTPADGAIDLQGSVHDAARLVRASTRPYPGAFYTNEDGLKIIIWKAAISSKEPTLCHSCLCVLFKDGYLIASDWQVGDV